MRAAVLADEPKPRAYIRTVSDGERVKIVDAAGRQYLVMARFVRMLLDGNIAEVYAYEVLDSPDWKKDGGGVKS
jgi:hypothetical protein